MHAGRAALGRGGLSIMPPEVNYRSGHFPARKLLWLVEVLEVGWNCGIRLKFKAAPGTLCLSPRPSQFLPVRVGLSAINLPGKAIWLPVPHPRQEIRPVTLMEAQTGGWHQAGHDGHSGGTGGMRDGCGERGTYQETARWRLPCPQKSNRLRPVSRRFQTISQTQRPRE